MVGAVAPRRFSRAQASNDPNPGSLSGGRHNATVTIPVLLFAMDCRLANQVGQFCGTALAAPPRSSRSVNAGVVGLRGMDTKQPNPLAEDLDRVAIDDTGRAN